MTDNAFCVHLHVLMLFRSLYIRITPVCVVSWKQIDIVYLKWILVFQILMFTTLLFV